MTGSKKRILKAAVLASVLAMSVCGSAWAANSITTEYNSNDLKTYAQSDAFTFDSLQVARAAADISKSTVVNEIIGHTVGDDIKSILFDGGWYSPDNKFYYIGKNDSGAEVLKVILLDNYADSGVAAKQNYIRSQLSEADKETLLKYSKDHNAEEDAVGPRKNEIESYSEAIYGISDLSLNSNDKATLTELFEHTYEFNADLVFNVNKLEEYARKETDKYLDTKIDNIGIKESGSGEDRTLYFINGYGVESKEIDISNTTLDTTKSFITWSDGNLNINIQDTAGNAETGTADIGKYIKENAGNAYYNYNGAEGATNTTINEAITEALKHNSVKAGDTNIIVNDKDADGDFYRNADGGIEYRVSLGTTLTGLESVTTQKVITEKVTLGVEDNKTDITYADGDISYTYNGDTIRIATENDGMQYGADSGEDVSLKLNERLDVVGGSNINTSIASVEDGVAQIMVNLNDNITVNSVKTNELTVTNNATVGNNLIVNNDLAVKHNASVAGILKVGQDLVVEHSALVKDSLTVEDHVIVGKDLSVGNNANITNNLVVGNDIAVGNNLSVKNILTTKILKATEATITPNLYLGEGRNKVTYANDRITYQDNNKQTQEVANLNDGYTYNGDIMKLAEGETEAYAKLNKTISVQGGYKGAEKNLTSENIGVVTTQGAYGDDVKMEVKLSESITGLKDITVDGGADGKDGATTTITKDGIEVVGTQGDQGEPGKTVTVNYDKVDVGGNRIEGVADGVNPTDAVNVRQLNKLGNRVDKVGAGAAALAALHPLDFDPDDKLSFSAGVGNYGGETATALGAFYRPTEKVMFSAAGTMGNGENMVNMGVTFALDKTNNVSNSRVAMAREIQDLREQVAALTALVTQLAGRNNPALLDTVMFPDVPENHWAYDYIDGLQKRGIIEGYPDGNFGGDRSMTRYEYAAMLYRALEKGFPVDSRLLDEFDAELGRIRIDRIKGEDNDPNKTERVRVNNYQDRDDYGSKLVTVAAAK